MAAWCTNTREAWKHGAPTPPPGKHGSMAAWHGAPTPPNMREVWSFTSTNFVCHKSLQKSAWVWFGRRRKLIRVSLLSLNLCNTQYAVCNMHYTVCTMQFALCNILCAICTLQYAQCSVQYAGCVCAGTFSLHIKFWH